RQQRMLVITGPRGSGKSSFLRAGVISQLKNGALPAQTEGGESSDRWRYIEPFTVRAEPLEQLARALCLALCPKTEADPEQWVQTHAAGFRKSAAQLVEVLGETTPVVLVIERFEELV